MKLGSGEVCAGETGMKQYYKNLLKKPQNIKNNHTYTYILSYFVS